MIISSVHAWCIVHCEAQKTRQFFYHNFYNNWPILIETDKQFLGYISHKVR